MPIITDKQLTGHTNRFATSRVQSNNFYLQGGVTLFNGFQKLNGIRQNQLNLMASRMPIST
ncbi:MAG: hypothetical protein IPN08_08495 [Bacteroidales bacterium]|nr:hypothetical protein [Bacteroidales bacterium]